MKGLRNRCLEPLHLHIYLSQEQKLGLNWFENRRMVYCRKWRLFKQPCMQRMLGGVGFGDPILANAAAPVDFLPKMYKSTSPCIPRF